MKAKLTTKVVVYDYKSQKFSVTISTAKENPPMTALQKNIDHYMDRKGIQFYSDLLMGIAHQLGIKGREAYDFAQREKSNFSKMLKGERPLKYEFIIPLEKIFGIPLAKMLDEDAYKLPVDRNEVPIVKGFRYYAYRDDPELYEKELDSFLTKRSQSILSCTDEFEKTFLDYVVEYGSLNAVRFLRDKYQIKMRLWNNQFQSSLDNSLTMWVHNGVEFARLVAQIGDIQLFNDIYDPYYLMATNGYYFDNSLWIEGGFQEILLDNRPLFESLFVPRQYELELGPSARKMTGKRFISFTLINPIVNCCLQYALSHLPKYRPQALEILRFGIDHNQKVIQGLPIGREPVFVDECGGVRKGNEPDIIDILIRAPKTEIEDQEIQVLVNRLPQPKPLF